MPRIGFIGVAVSAEDHKMAERIRRAASGYPDKVLTEIRHLESFVNANRFDADMSTGDIMALFAAQWLNTGRAPSTLEATLDDFRRFSVDPRRLDEARARVERYRILNGVSRMRMEQGRIFIRKISASPYPGITQSRPIMANIRERMCFWGACCVTGNRADNVLCIRAMALEEGLVKVSWGRRKVHSNVVVKYQFEWSGVPAGWMCERWAELKSRPWQFTEGERGNIASTVNSWLRSWGQQVTSSSARERVDGKVRVLYETRAMTHEEYERVMDHKYTTSLDHYDQGVEV